MERTALERQVWLKAGQAGWHEPWWITSRASSPRLQSERGGPQPVTSCQAARKKPLEGFLGR